MLLRCKRRFINAYDDGAEEVTEGFEQQPIDGDTFGPGEIDVGDLTSAQRQAIMEEGAGLSNDPLWTRDEVLRWRRFLRVADGWQYCSQCELWTERRQEDPCKNCGTT
jgi:hypothetical protein